MPHIIKLILLQFITLPISPLLASNNIYIVSSGVYGPYKTYCKDVSITLHITPPKTFAEKIISHHFKVVDKNDEILYISKSDSLDGRSESNYLLTLPTNDYLSKDGMHCLYELHSIKGILVNIDFTIYPYSDTNFIDPFDYNNSAYISNNRSFYFDNNKAVYIEEKFTFSDLVNYFKFDTYYRLSLSQFVFNVELYNSYTYLESYILLENLVPSLSSLTNLEGNNSKIPLSLKIDENFTISLQFKDILYVEPGSLHMSTTPKTGFVKTRYFYLPTNRKEEVLNQTFTFVIKEIGFNKTSLKWDMNLESVINLIGDCSNSEYCVVGGTK